MKWTVETLNEIVDAELEALPCGHEGAACAHRKVD